jgi:hypothetical protein
MNLNRSVSILFLLLLLMAALPSAGQKKSPKSNIKEKNQAVKDDPWAEYEEEKDSVSRWALGINVGGYFANKVSANYYNGTPGNINNVDFVMKNISFYRDIMTTLGLGTSDTLVIPDYPGTLESFPLNMKYHAAITAGVFLRYNFNRKNGIFIEADYTLLKAEDVIKMEVNPPDYLTDQHDYRLFPIIGREERAMIDLAYQRSFLMKSKIYFFINVGATMCYTHVKKSALVVAGREFSLINTYGNNKYQSGYNNQQFNVVQYGLGFGPILGGGVGLPLTDLIGIEPGFIMQYYPVNLEGYPDFKPSFSIYLRILLGFSHSKVI